MTTRDISSDSAQQQADELAVDESSTTAWRRRLIFGLVAITLFMTSIDQSIVATALPVIDRELHARTNWGGWAFTAYTLSSVMVLPLAGKMSDQFGRRRVFVCAVAIFSAASLLCGLSVNIYMLIALRFIQAIGGGAVFPSAAGVVSELFGRNRDKAIGMFGSITMFGFAVGPIFGGLFVKYWTWRGIFLINVPIGIAFVVLAMRFIPRSSRREAASVDARGSAIYVVLLLSLMYGITALGDGHTEPWDPIFLGPIVLSLVLTVFFVRRAKFADNPLIPIRLISGKGFAPMNCISVFSGACSLSFGALIPLYAHTRYHMSYLGSGTLLTAEGFTMAVTGFLAVALLRKTGYRWPMSVGFVTMGMGFVLAALTPHGVSPYTWLSFSTAIVGLGIGISFPASMNANMRLARDQVGSITGLRIMFRQSGSIIGISVTTAILARSMHPGLAQAHVFVAFAVIMVALTPVVFRIPEHRGNW